MEEIKEIKASEMDSQGRFTCPKCKVEIDPDLESEYDLEVNGECGAHKLDSVLIKHKCGQKLLLLMEVNPT